MSEPRPLTPSATVLAISLYILWGSMYAATKYGYRDASPLLFSGLRMIPATLVLALVVRLRGASFRLNREQARVVLTITSMFFLNTVLLYLGINYTSVGHSTILINSSVIFVMLFSRPLLGVRVRAFQWAGVACAFIGISLIMRDRGDAGGHVTLLGDVLMLASGFMWAMYNIFYTRLGRIVDNMVMVFYMDSTTMIPFLLLSPMFEVVRFSFTTTLVISVIYVSLCTHVVGFLVWNWILARYDTNKASSFMFVLPVVGVFLGAVIFGEPVGLWVLIGLPLVCSGIFLVNRSPSGR